MKIKEIISKAKLAVTKKNIITMGICLSLSAVALFGVLKVSSLLITLYLGYELVKNTK